MNGEPEPEPTIQTMAEAFYHLLQCKTRCDICQDWELTIDEDDPPTTTS